MREYCVEVVNVNLRNQPVHYAGPFLDVESAERWISEHEADFHGRQFRIKQLVDI